MSCKLQFKHIRSCLGNLFTPTRPVCIRRECAEIRNLEIKHVKLGGTESRYSS